MNERNSRYLRKQLTGSADTVQKLVEDSMMQDLAQDGSNEEIISSTQRKIRARREAARIANQAALAMTTAGAVDEGEMEIESTGNGTTLGRPRVISA